MSGACRLQALTGYDKEYELYDGISLKAHFPQEAAFEMDSDFPKDIRTEDFIASLSSVLVVSERARHLLGDLKNNEYLPVTITNHKGRKEKGPFYILHQVELVDCINLEQSIFTRNAIDPDLLSSIDRLVIDLNRIDTTVPIFRLKYFPYAPLFREDIIEKIQAAGLTGIKFIAIEDYEY